MTALKAALNKAGIETPEQRLAKIAKQAIKNSANAQGAATAIAAKVRQDADLLHALVGDIMINHAIRVLVAQHSRKAAKAVKPPKATQPTPRRVVNRAAELAAYEAATKSVLATFIVNGQPIGRLTAAEVRAASETSARHGRFMAALAHGVPDDMRIGDARTADEANDMHRRIVAGGAS